jgi:hypothetical protein
MTLYKLQGASLLSDRPFKHNGLQYPANWLRRSSPEQRAAIGITEESEPQFDHRFYWSKDQPKDLGLLKSQFKAQQKEIAQSILRPTDWVVIRVVEEPGKPEDKALKTYRAAVRSVSSTREAEIDAVTTVEELVTQLGTLTPWPDQP